MMVIGAGAFGREGGVFMNGMSVLVKNPTRSFLLPLCKDTEKAPWGCKTEGGPSL